MTTLVRICARPPLLHHLDRLWPDLGRNIALAYLPWEYCQVGRKLSVEYFAEIYPVESGGCGLQAAV